MQRFPEGLEGKCAAVVSRGVAYIVVNDPECSEGITRQTQGALGELDRLLNKVGSGKDRILQAAVYLADIADKPDMDAVWRPWIGGRENWPQRACLGVQLDPGYLIEIVVTAEAS